MLYGDNGVWKYIGMIIYAYYPPSKKESELIHTFLDYFKEGNTPKKQVTVHNY